MQAQIQVDPIKFEVIRNALVEATEEMAAALKRSAYSTNIKTRCDFSCALFDRHLPRCGPTKLWAKRPRNSSTRTG